MIYRVNELRDNITMQEHDSSMIIFSLTDNEDNAAIVGADNGGAYAIKVSKSVHSDWKLAVGDFIGYCTANNINAVLEMSQTDYDTAMQHYSGHSFNERVLRTYDPQILIHSTTMESWNHIQRDGMLKSWNRLRSEQAITEEHPIGIQLGDPASFSDYIMFGGGVTGEIVVNSKQSGAIVMDVNTQYLTGARLYFDAKKIAQDGLLVRDGCHTKVKDALPLEPYLIWAATWDKIGLPSQVSTPKIFADTSDRQFRSLFPCYSL